MSFANFTFKRQPSQREVSREAINNHVAAYLGAGGRITTLPAPTLRPLLESTRRPLPESTRKPLGNDERCVHIKPETICRPPAEKPKSKPRHQLPLGYISLPEMAEWLGCTYPALKARVVRGKFQQPTYIPDVASVQRPHGWEMTDVLRWRASHGL
jgi:hypothetical protein